MGLTVQNTETQAILERHVHAWGECRKCLIGEIAKHKVFGRGTVPCDILFIGEAPGKTEDVTGTPFIGKAGKLLDKWIHRAIPANGPTWAITNTVLCRPCDGYGLPNRQPTFTELTNCGPRLIEFVLKIAKPKALVLLGRVAAVNAPEWVDIPRIELSHPARIFHVGGENGWLDHQEGLALKKFVKQEFPCR